MGTGCQHWARLLFLQSPLRWGRWLCPGPGRVESNNKRVSHPRRTQSHHVHWDIHPGSQWPVRPKLFLRCVTDFTPCRPDSMPVDLVPCPQQPLEDVRTAVETVGPVDGALPVFLCCPKGHNSFSLRTHSRCFHLTHVEAFPEGLSDLPKANSQRVEQLGPELGFADPQAPGLHSGAAALGSLLPASRRQSQGPDGFGDSAAATWLTGRGGPGAEGPCRLLSARLAPSCEFQRSVHT